ncbi:MAG: hypothetical protein GF331_24300 [Chitinivibrionales bacterium]|nr:hypothetical protein [Chitinivibrionales bacterium]
MKTVLAHLVLCAGVVFGQATPDIHDTVCTVYLLDSVQEAQFSSNDGILAAFWDEWDVQNAQELTRDYIQMDPEHNAQPGRDYYTGPDDNTLIVRGAYGRLGLYLLVTMVDDDFLDRDMGNQDSVHRDVIELYIDTLSSQENRDLGGAVYVGLYDATLTYTSMQFLLSMGRERVYDDFRLAYYDPALWSWQSNWISFTDAEQTHDGMAFEAVALLSTRRAQEWFLPWTWVGVGGPAEFPPPQGRRFAFAGGCHDMDSDQGDTVCSLKWKNRGNPWAPKVDGQYNDTWGDLEIGPPLTATSTRREIAALSRMAAAANPTKTTECFTVTGAVVSSHHAGRSAGLFLRRTRGISGRGDGRVVPIVRLR